MLIGVGSGVAAYVYGKRNRAALDLSDAEDSTVPFDRDEPNVIPNSMDIDPADPVQGLDEVQEFHVEELGFDAMSAGDIENDMVIEETLSSMDEESMELDTPSETTLDSIERSAHDTGDLYGVHTPPAVDRTHGNDEQTMDEGQNWIEALESSAIENGAEPEQELDDIVDDDDIYASPHPTDTRDTPVADRGSGGPGGI